MFFFKKSRKEETSATEDLDKVDQKPKSFLSSIGNFLFKSITAIATFVVSFFLFDNMIPESTSTVVNALNTGAVGLAALGTTAAISSAIHNTSNHNTKTVNPSSKAVEESIAPEHPQQQPEINEQKQQEALLEEMQNDLKKTQQPKPSTKLSSVTPVMSPKQVSKGTERE